MITDPRVFEDDHLPRSLYGRDAELDHLARSFRPATRGEAADDVLVSGPSGVGKTALARFALGRLDATADMAWTYVQCVGRDTTGILQDIVAAHPDADEPPASEPSIEALHDRLATAASRPFVV